jgi:large subunit ribosomal protein L16
LLLKPRQFKYKNKFKLRTSILHKRYTLNFGQLSLLIFKNSFITANYLFKLKLFLKKLNKKAEKTKRKVWIKTFPFIPLSKKPLGLRMGKGGGKLHS